jgi:predicted metal-dependent hydrolase
MNGFTSLIGTILVASVFLFQYSSTDNLIYVKSDIDHFSYLVRDKQDKQKAANMLAKLRQNMELLINHMVMYKDTTYIKYKSNIEELENKVKGITIHETPENSSYTSYSVNKGDKLVFCVRSKKLTNHIHDINLLMYVTLHEMAHIATPEYGHTPLFKEIFAFLTQIATKLDIYRKIQFEMDPHEYCGLIITNSII